MTAGLATVDDAGQYLDFFRGRLLFPIFEAGFGAQFEFRSLLRFPISQRAFYLLGLGYGFADFGAVAAMFWIAAMLLATLTTRPVYTLAESSKAKSLTICRSNTAPRWNYSSTANPPKLSDSKFQIH